MQSMFKHKRYKLKLEHKAKTETRKLKLKRETQHRNIIHSQMNTLYTHLWTEAEGELNIKHDSFIKHDRRKHSFQIGTEYTYSTYIVCWSDQHTLGKYNLKIMTLPSMVVQ